MFQTTKAEFDAALSQIENRLDELASELGDAIATDRFRFALVALGHRAHSFFRGFVVLCDSDTPAAATTLLRSAVEINLTLRFIVADPGLHAELWIAESERQSLVLVRQMAADRELSAKHADPFDLDASWVQERDAYVTEVRHRALRAHVIGVGDRGRVMPSMEVIATHYGDLATREAYRLAYRALSNPVHAAARSFGPAHFEETEGGFSFREVAPTRAERAMNATTFASTLCVLSEPLSLGVFDDAVVLKEALLRAQILDDQASSE